MRTVSIRDLKNQLSSCPKSVRNGEEIVIKEMDWDQFFLAPAGDVSREIAVEVALDSRGDR